MLIMECSESLCTFSQLRWSISKQLAVTMSGRDAASAPSDLMMMHYIKVVTYMSPKTKTPSYILSDLTPFVALLKRCYNPTYSFGEILVAVL